MMGLWASGLRSLRPLASTHSVPRLTTPSFSPHINPFRKNSKLKQNILWFGLSFVQISCRKIQSFPFLVDFHSFLPKRARKYHFLDSIVESIWSRTCFQQLFPKCKYLGFTAVKKQYLSMGFDMTVIIIWRKNGIIIKKAPTSEVDWRGGEGCCIKASFSKSAGAFMFLVTP